MVEQKHFLEKARSATNADEEERNGLVSGTSISNGAQLKHHAYKNSASMPAQPDENCVNGTSQHLDDDAASQRSGYSMQSRTNFSAIDSEVPLSQLDSNIS